jgi:hypothetical protein
MFKKVVMVSFLGLGVLAGCSDADVASRNLSTAADAFQIDRRIVFYNSIQDVYLLSIEGRCSIEPTKGKLAVTCKTSETTYKKHYLGISDNVTYFAEQLGSSEVGVYQYKVIFKPESLIPNIDMKISG